MSTTLTRDLVEMAREIRGYAKGYGLDFFEVIFDEESFHDRLGGGFYRGRESFRSGVLIR